MNQRADIDKIYLYAKDTYEAKYLILVKKREDFEQSILMTLKLLLNAHIIWMIFTIILKKTTKIKNVKY